MGLRTIVRVECELPDGGPPGDFSTPDLDAPFDDVRLTPGMDLVREAPRRGAASGATPSDLVAPQEGQGQPMIMQATGFASLRDGERRYSARISRGRVLGMRQGGLEAWAVPGGDPRAALRLLREAFSPGSSPDRAEVAAFLDRSLACATPGEAEGA